MRDTTVPRFNPPAEPARTVGRTDRLIFYGRTGPDSRIWKRDSKKRERERDWVWDWRRRVQRSRRRSRAPTGEFTVAFGHGHPLVIKDVGMKWSFPSICPSCHPSMARRRQSCGNWSHSATHLHKAWPTWSPQNLSKCLCDLIHLPDLFILCLHWM